MSSRPVPSPPPQPSSPGRVRFADFEVDLRARELYRGGERVQLQDRPFEVLAALLERSGEVVLRKELRERLWPGHFVEFDNNLNTAVTKLRRALDDTTQEPRIVETLPKRGYRLLVPVEAVGDGDLPSGRPRVTVRRWRALTFGLLAVLAGALALALMRSSPATPPKGDESAGAPLRTSLLVVLPFAALEGEGASVALADSLTEELIGRLAELLPSQLGVIARTSSMQFRGNEADVAAIRQLLGVDYLLEGSVSRDTEGLRIRTRFVHASDQAHLWAESYEASLDELPRLQRSIAERIATAVSSQLRSAGALGEPQLIPAAAWEAYLQARFLLGSRPEPTEETSIEAIALLEQAVSVAPHFALAWSALADASYLDPAGGRESQVRAEQAARRALAADPGLARPRHRLAILALYRDWDWEEAERQFDWALSLAPHLAVGHHSKAAWFSTQGRHEEALQSIERAMRLDPLSVVLHADAGWYLFVARRYEEAIERCRQALELDPDHRGANSYLFHSLNALHRSSEAGEVARRLLTIEGAGDELLRQATQSPEAAIEVLRRFRLSTLEEELEAGRASAGQVALAHLELGDGERALEFLETGLEEREGWIYPFLAVYPLLDPLRDDVRLERWIDTVGIPVAAAR